MSLNVNRSVTDMFYRYKMPKLVAKVEGKGNGIKTVIVNMVDIAKALGRPPTYPTKYFGCELGAQTNFDITNERFIVNGSHDATRLQDLLDGFIRKFVLCPECDNPETVLSVQAKKNTLSQSCKACGYNGLIKGVHRLITYIIKNPPEISPAAQGVSTTTGKRGKRGKKGENGETNGHDGDSPRNGSDEGEWNDAIEKNGTNKDSWEDDWGDDATDEAIRKRQAELSDKMKSLAVTSDSEKTEKERMDLFYKFLQNKKESGKLDEKEILAEAERLDVRAKSALVLAELLFDKNIIENIKTYRKVLLRFCHDNTKTQKYLLGGVELVIQTNKELLPKVPLIFKALYDGDILDEEILVEWHSKVSKKYVSKELSAEIHAKAEPFIKWLKEAEEEESSDSEDEIEIEYDDRARISGLQQQEKSPATPAAKQIISNKKDEDEEDLNIDEI